MRWSSSNFLWKAHSYTLQYKGPRVVFWSLKSLKKWQRQWCRQGQFGQFLHVRLCLSGANWHHAYYVHKQNHSSSLSAFSFDFFIFFHRSKIRLFLWLLFWPENRKKNIVSLVTSVTLNCWFSLLVIWYFNESCSLRSRVFDSLFWLIFSHRVRVAEKRGEAKQGEKEEKQERFSSVAALFWAY